MKLCEICKGEVVKKYHDSKKRFEAKRTCGWDCAKELWRRNRKKQ